MYFIKNPANGLLKRIHRVNGAALSAPTKPGWLARFWQTLTGEAHYHRIGELFLLWVLSMHIWAGVYLLQPAEALTLAKPMLIMEASMLSIPSQKKAVVPTPPKPAPPKKKLIKKAKPVIHKQVAIPNPLAIEPTLPTPSVTESAQNESDSKVTGEQRNAPPTETKTETYSEADYQANAGFNPKPDYPAIARSRGYEGKIVLRVRVSAEGESEEVSVIRSTGYDILDDSAVEAVKRWKFVPARRGETQVACTVNVPIIFNLEN